MMKNFFKLTTALLCFTPLATTSLAADKPVLTIYTYDSFASEWGPGPVIEKAFEAQCSCDLRFVALDSSIGILGRVQIEGADSAADIVLGLDTNLTSIARDTGLFAAHGVASKANNLPITFSDDIFMPFDWGNFAFVYDTKRLSSPPASFDELINSSADLKIAIQDPRTSTPGLGLLLWMKSVYGDQAARKWAALQPKILTVTKGWWDSYSLFLEGEADMVLSYTTSPAYHMIAEGKYNYAAAAFSDGHYAQIEVAAMMKSAPQPELARQFMTFIQSPEFQQVIPTTNWMYPVTKAAVPAEFDNLVMPKRQFLFTAEDVAENKSTWVDEWLKASQN